MYSFFLLLVDHMNNAGMRRSMNDYEGENNICITVICLIFYGLFRWLQFTSGVYRRTRHSNYRNDLRWWVRVFELWLLSDILQVLICIRQVLAETVLLMVRTTLWEAGTCAYGECPSTRWSTVVVIAISASYVTKGYLAQRGKVCSIEHVYDSYWLWSDFQWYIIVYTQFLIIQWLLVFFNRILWTDEPIGGKRSKSIRQSWRIS